MKINVLLVLVAAVMGCGSPDAAEEAGLVQPPPVAFDGALVSDASATIAHGERLTWVLGCRGCHGKDLQGKRFYELYASNLTRDVHKYSPAQLEALMRAGVRTDGRDMWGMPSELFQHLSEPDMAALLAHLRSLRPAGPPTQAALPFPPDVREAIAKGEIKPAAEFVRDSKGIGPVDLGPQHALGRYISRVTCAECHGAELKGGGDMPDLIVASAYTREEFERLMTEGVPTGDRKLKPLMVSVSKNRFSKMTPQERDALYAYLKARAEQPQ